MDTVTLPIKSSDSNLTKKPAPDRRVQVTRPKHYRQLMNGQIVRTFPKVRGKAKVKAAKRARRYSADGLRTA